MEGFFGRKKLTKANRSNTNSSSDLAQNSVPYDRVGAGRSPMQVGTVSQGLRATGAIISAPITNPTLTLEGTDINIHNMTRTSHQAYGEYSSPTGDDSLDGPLTASSRHTSRTKSIGESGSSGGGFYSAGGKRKDESMGPPSSIYSGRSGNTGDFGAYPISPSSSTRTSNLPSSRSIAPSRVSGTDNASVAASGHGKYPSSITSNGSEAISTMTAQLKEHLPHQVRESLHNLRQSYYDTTGGATNGSVGEFNLARPENPEEIEAMFQRIAPERDIGEGVNMTLDQKWGIVYAHEQDRWNQLKKKEAQMRKSAAVGNGPSAVYAKDTPEWYLKKFMDQTITAKHVGSLTVSLRSLPIDWMHHFISLQGIQVVARALNHISLKGSLRRNADIELEYELLKCLKFLLNHESGADDAVAHPKTISAIACSLSTSHIPSRRLITDLLTFICYYNNGMALGSVLKALDALSAANNETGTYDFWFKSLTISLSGRGKMGSLVGASQDIRKHGGTEAALTDYAQSNLILINGILTVDDFELRLHYRSQMEAAGLRRIFDICHEFQHDSLEKQISSYEKLAASDQELLVQNFDQEILKDLSDPYDVYRAILGSVKGTPAYPYFLSSLQHLLLIKAENETKARYYQLIDELVTSIVLDKKQNFSGGLSGAVGVSVARLVAQFGEQERGRIAEEEAALARREANELRIQKEKLEEEIAAGGEGLVGNLKEKLTNTEEKLRVSRLTTDALQARLAEQKKGYEEQIAQLELQIYELFRMLRDGGISSKSTGPDGAVLDRNELISNLERQMERRKTIGILEGRHRKKAGAASGTGIEDAITEEEEEEEEAEGDVTIRQLPVVSGDAPRRTANGIKKKPKGPANAPLERASQYMDAEDEQVREHMEENLAKGPELIYPRNSVQTGTSARSSPVRPPPSKLPGGSSSRFLEDLRARVGGGAGGRAGGGGIGNGTGTGGAGHLVNGESVSEDSNTMDTSDFEPSRASGITDTPPSSIGGGSGGFDSNGRPAFGGMADSLTARIAQMQARGKPVDLSSPPTQAVPLPPAQSTSESNGDIPIPPPPPPLPTFRSGSNLASKTGSSDDIPAPPPLPPMMRGAAKNGTTTPDGGFTPPPPPPPMAFSPMSKAGSLPSLPGSTRSSVQAPSPFLMALGGRKDVPLTANTRMKQLQWDKISQQAAGKTIWKDEEVSKEQEWVQKLLNDGVWKEMEEDFKAKQLVINLMAKHKKAELKSVLDPQTKQRVAIIIQRVKHLSPEEIARELLKMSPELFNEGFLSEMKSILPSPEQVGKLNVYRNADAEELGGLHPSDRLMVQLIKIDRLGPRLQGMLYRCRFDEQITLWEESAKKLVDAGESLLHAVKFKELMSLILLIGNYMNGTGAKGGAYGFKISSINKLVDTKSVNNTTLLHFVERTVSSHFPEMESFLEELAKPAEAYRVNLQDTRKGTTELREGLKTLRDELQEHFADVDSAAPYDLFGKKMWRFVGEAKERLDDLLDEVRLADSTFIEVVKYYGEDEKNMTSTEFFGIFKTFVTSYQKCKNENRTAAEERAAAERRRQQVEEAKAARAKVDTSQVGPEDTQMLDSLIEKLRAGDSVKGRATRKRNGKDRSARPAPSPLSLALLTEGGGDGPSGDAGDLARGMLAALKSDGFAPENMDAIVPIPMSSSTTPMSPTRRRARIKSDPLLAEELENLTRESELNTPPIMDGYPSPTDQDQPGELRDKE